MPAKKIKIKDNRDDRCFLIKYRWIFDLIWQNPAFRDLPLICNTF
jgi:hypothetical protein